MRVVVFVASAACTLGYHTNYSYGLSRAHGQAATVQGRAASPFGVAYTLESLLQLATDRQQCGSFSLQDHPSLAHRGLLLDTGRRFHPVPMLKRQLEAMAAVKLNVLHLYLSEECFRVESKLFPRLTASSCTVEPNFHFADPGFYTQADIRELVEFARVRGIRLVPEIDLPAHTAGICAGLKQQGIVCCGQGGKYGFGQILDDPGGKSVSLVKLLLAEMAALFPDASFHVGADD